MEPEKTINTIQIINHRAPATTPYALETSDLIENTSYIALRVAGEMVDTFEEDDIDQDAQYDYYHSDHDDHRGDDDFQDMDWMTDI